MMGASGDCRCWQISHQIFYIRVCDTTTMFISPTAHTRVFDSIFCRLQAQRLSCSRSVICIYNVQTSCVKCVCVCLMMMIVCPLLLIAQNENDDDDDEVDM